MPSISKWRFLYTFENSGSYDPARNPDMSLLYTVNPHLDGNFQRSPVLFTPRGLPSATNDSLYKFIQMVRNPNDTGGFPSGKLRASILYVTPEISASTAIRLYGLQQGERAVPSGEIGYESGFAGEYSTLPSESGSFRLSILGRDVLLKTGAIIKTSPIAVDDNKFVNIEFEWQCSDDPLDNPRPIVNLYVRYCITDTEPGFDELELMLFATRDYSLMPAVGGTVRPLDSLWQIATSISGGGHNMVLPTVGESVGFYVTSRSAPAAWATNPSPPLAYISVLVPTGYAIAEHYEIWEPQELELSLEWYEAWSPPSLDPILEHYEEWES